jgi:hypothetical protein
MSNENTGNINSEVSSQLTSLLGGQSSLSSLVSGLASAAKLNESKVDKVHDKAYNQDGAEALSNQDLGAAAGKQAFEQLFNGSNSELASSVTNMFSTAATSKDTNDRSISDILSSFSSQGSQGSGSQKGTFEKIVDLIAKEVAKACSLGRTILTAGPVQGKREQPRRRCGRRYADIHPAHDQEEDLRGE